MGKDEPELFNKNSAKIAAALMRDIQALKHNLPEFLESVSIQAKITRHKFEALKKEGFTDEQALELSKKL